MSYVFNPEALHEEVRAVIGMPVDAMIPRLVRALSTRWPGHIHDSGEWIFNNAGGAMGQMRVLHASLSEYVLLFSTPIGTEGHSGRFFADDFFFILDGEQWSYPEGSLRREVYRPGDMNYLRRGHAKGYRVPEHFLGMEYARGAIPLMLPFGVADTLTSTLDLRTLWRTLQVYTRCATAALVQARHSSDQRAVPSEQRRKDESDRPEQGRERARSRAFG